MMSNYTSNKPTTDLGLLLTELKPDALAPVVCEEAGDPSESESEEELEGDWCYGDTDPRTVITYTMAGGGAHWWNYEVHFDVDVQKEVYVNNTNGRHRKRGEKLFYHKVQTDKLRLEHNDFDLENEDWVELML